MSDLDLSQIPTNQLLAMLQQGHSAPNDAITQSALDPTAGMSGLDKFNAGVGKAFTDLWHGGQQLIPGMGPSAQEVAEQRQLDAPLMRTGAGLAGNVAGYAIPGIVGTALAPVTLSTVGGAGALGGAMGLLTPSTSPTEKLLSGGIGTASGAGGQLAANAIGRFFQPIQSQLSPEGQRLAQVAANENIPLDAAQQTGSKPLSWMNAAFGNLPFTSGPEAAKNAAQRGAFTTAVLKRAGIDSNTATQDVLQAGKTALGNTFETIAGRNSIDMNPVVGDLGNITAQAGRRLTPADASTISNTVDDILSQANQNGVLAGTNYQGWRSELGRLSRSNDTQGHYFGQIKKTLDNAFASQAVGDDAAQWAQASSQYGNLKTIMNAMGGPAGQASEGYVPPSALAAALRNAVGKEGNALGRGDLNDLARVGQTFLRAPPDSGTASRAFYQHALTGLGSMAIGAGAGGIEGHGSFEDMAKGAGYGALGLGGARAAQALLNSGVGQRYLTSGIAGASTPTAQALADALRRGLITGAVSAPGALANFSQQ